MSQRIYKTAMRPSSLNKQNKFSNSKKNAIQLQSYTDMLVENNKTYQQEIFMVKRQNTHLRNQLEKSIGDSLKLKNIHQDQISELKQSFNKEIEHLVGQLKDILEQKQRMQCDYKQIIDEMVQIHKEQMKDKNQQILTIETIFREKLLKMGSKLDLTQKEAEKSYFEGSEAKLSLMKQIDGLNFEVNTLNTDNQEKQKEIEQLKSIIKKIQEENCILKQKCEDIDMRVYSVQQQKNAIIIDLKNHNKTLSEEIRKLESQVRKLDDYIENKNSQALKDINLIKKQQKDIDTLTLKFSQIKIQLQDAMKAKQECSHLLKVKEELLVKERSTFKMNKDMLEKDNRQLVNTLDDLTLKLQRTENNLQKVQNEAENLLQKLRKTEYECKKLSQFSQDLEHQNRQIVQEYQSTKLECKSFREKIQLQQNHISTLEKINIQLKNAKQLSNYQQSHNERQRKNIIMNQQAQYQKLKYQLQRTSEELNLLKKDNLFLEDQIDKVMKDYELKLMETQHFFKTRLQNMAFQIDLLKKNRAANRFYQEELYDNIRL